MGRVFRARHETTSRSVALKILHRTVALDPVARERFEREYETGKSLRHPYIVEVLDFGRTDEGLPFMTMEYLPGAPLTASIREDRSIEPSRLVRIACQLALGLSHAHAAGVVHRDLKPDNILVCDTPLGDEVRILDFGSVKLTRGAPRKLTALGTTLGSPFYMSPEQATGSAGVDSRSDVFALAAIVYELATGRRAFDGADVPEILAKVTGEEPPPVSARQPMYPWRFDDAVRRGLAKDPSARWQTPLDLARAILHSVGLSADVARWACADRPDIARALRLQQHVPVQRQGTKAHTSIPPGLPERSSEGILLFLAFGAAAAVVAGAIALVL